MGVPSFFRWLTRKFPSVLIYCIQEEIKCIDNVEIPQDLLLPNPNGIEFDNLYLDMNGIIHPCCHPEDKLQPSSIDEMIVKIFNYIDDIFAIVRPRKLLYMAIDGVAPRAKMNQQRSRRFRAAKENYQKKIEIENIKNELIANGVTLPSLKTDINEFDSNCITPGTDFLFYLSKCLSYYIVTKLNTDPAWQEIKVILSDSNNPGEGEHKIVDFIRRERNNPSYNPNTSHVLYGADADLIMLGLSSHEPHFTIIREQFEAFTPKPCDICGNTGHTLKECKGEAKQESDEVNSFLANTKKQFVFIHLFILREYLEKELAFDPIGKFTFDLERAIDDWVFLCFFVGNDFLPHLPSLEIREGAIDRLMTIYKNSLGDIQDYITFNGKVDLSKVSLLLNKLGKEEDSIFKTRRNEEIERNRRMNMKKRRYNNQNMDNMPRSQDFGTRQQFFDPPYSKMPRNDRYNHYNKSYNLRGNLRSLKFVNAQKDSENLLAAQDLKSNLFSTNASKEFGYIQTDSINMQRSAPISRYENSQNQRYIKNEIAQGDGDETTEDRVRFWESGWRDRYYNEKFSISCFDSEFLKNIVYHYSRGLCWVFSYYYQGCKSWNWFYPYHYAPFASDFQDLSVIPNYFDAETKPFSPLEQLMAVFPSSSRNFLPLSWQKLMLDSDSPIIDFYPSEFDIDLNGKKFAWQGISLLPFVDESRLLAAIRDLYSNLTEEEKKRNDISNERLFVSFKHKAFQFICTIYENFSSGWVILPPELCDGISGLVSIDKEPILPQLVVKCPLETGENVYDNQVISCSFNSPEYDSQYIFKSELLSGLILPKPSLKPQNYEYVSSHTMEKQGTKFGYKNNPASRFIRSALPKTYSDPNNTLRFPTNSLTNSDNRFTPYKRRWNSAQIDLPPQVTSQSYLPSKDNPTSN